MKAIEEGTCRSCGALVHWCLSEKLKRIPLDADPVVGGNMVSDGAVARFVGDGNGDRVSHFATCPQAGRWRKR